MAKTHLNLDFGPRFDHLLATQPITRAKFVRWAVERALDDLQSGRVTLGAPQALAAPPAAATAAAAPSAPVAARQFNLKVIRGGDKVAWFPLPAVCEALGISQTDVRSQLDLDEDAQVLAGVLHVADLGINTALGVASSKGVDPKLVASFESWAQAQ